MSHNIRIVHRKQEHFTLILTNLPLVSPKVFVLEENLAQHFLCHLTL